MSAMLRANRTGGPSGNTRRTRSFSLSDGSSGGSSDSDEAGARLSSASMDDTPPRVRFSSVTHELGRMSVTSSTASGGSDRDATSAAFQLGKKPSGDVFMASPVKTALKTEQETPKLSTLTSIAENVIASSPIKDNEERRQTRAVTTGSALVPTTPGGRALRSMSSRHEIGGIDAQGIYPPSACVFVANLPEAKDDRALEAAVTREFSRYGTVFVKIRREMKGNTSGMPYAFAQYTNDEDAKNGMEKGRGAMILGRPCRTEMVKANRVFIVYRRNGDTTTPDTVREMLEPYGEFSKCERLSDEMQETLNLPPAVLVEFAKFDPKRDLNSAVRQHDKFRIDAFDLKKKTFVSRTDPDEEFLRKYDVDRRSVFVGGVPLDAEKEEIIDLFSTVGEVIDANIVKRPNNHGITARAFAFVEFARADTPDHAVKNLNGIPMRDAILKVERKAFKHAATPRRVKSQAFSIRASATPKTPRASAAAAPGSTTKRETPVPAAEQSYAFPGAGQPFVPLGYAVAGHAAPADGQPLVGASGLPVTPSTTPFAPNPFTYAGGYWPGMSIAQDPITGQTFWAYTPPVGATPGPGPTAETPTRGHAREHQYFQGA